MQRLQELVVKGIEDDFTSFVRTSRSARNALKPLGKVRVAVLRNLPQARGLDLLLDPGLEGSVLRDSIPGPPPTWTDARTTARDGYMRIVNACKQYEGQPELVNMINMTLVALAPFEYRCPECDHALAEKYYCRNQGC